MFEPTVPDPSQISKIHTMRQVDMAKQYAGSLGVNIRFAAALTRIGGLLITLGERLQTRATPVIRNHSTT